MLAKAVFKTEIGTSSKTSDLKHMLHKLLQS